MDLSKLPKLSQSPPPPQNDPAAPQATLPNQSYQSQPYASPPPAYGPSAGPEAFVSIAIGALLLLLSPQLIKYLLGGNIGTFTDEKGQPMRYVDSVFFQGDLAVTCFAIVLIIEGLIIAFVRKPTLVLVALVFTVLTTLGNLLYLLKTYQSYGLPLISAFAVIFGIYISIYEWRTFQQLRSRQPHA